MLAARKGCKNAMTDGLVFILLTTLMLFGNVEIGFKESIGFSESDLKQKQ